MRSIGVIAAAAFVWMGGCVAGPEVAADDAGAVRGAVAQPDEDRRILVDAMPVSMADGVETIPGERTYIVTVELRRAGQPVDFLQGQEFAVQYVVTRNGTMVVHDQIVLPASPRFVVPRGRPAPQFKFLVQTTKAPGPGYKLNVRVHLGELTGEPADPKEIKP